ncbi:MAG: FMN-binding glutamate synthase family protein, partial [Actinomycetota bacterium]|nr:FMN-binding glutamate synthase family protein [Actinomycetota bacterium]
AVRTANYVQTLRRDLVKVAQACGVEHPGLISTESVDILDGRTQSTPLHEVYGYTPGMGLPSAADREEIARMMTQAEPRHGSAPPSRSAVG